MLDRTDKRILDLLQIDATLAVAEIADQVGLSTTPCWRRLQRLEHEGYIDRRVALLSPEKLNAAVNVFVMLKVPHHSQAWIDEFDSTVRGMPEILEVYRMSGDIDYLLRIVVPDIGTYDAVYKRLINRVSLGDVSSSFAMEQIKFTTALPLDNVETTQRRKS